MISFLNTANLHDVNSVLEFFSFFFQFLFSSDIDVSKLQSIISMYLILIHIWWTESSFFPRRNIDHSQISTHGNQGMRIVEVNSKRYELWRRGHGQCMTHRLTAQYRHPVLWSTPYEGCSRRQIVLYKARIEPPHGQQIWVCAPHAGCSPSSTTQWCLP